jgi:hypothetical protein
MRAILRCCVLLAVLCKFINSSSLTRVCQRFEKNAKHEFHPLRHCQRSNKTVIAYSDAEDVDKCADFARRSRALAFNFSPRERRIEANLYAVNVTNTTKTRSDFYSCEALVCPEYQNFSTVVNDTRFDYYSMYTHPAREHVQNPIVATHSS